MSCSNDSAVTFTSTLALYLLLRYARPGINLKQAALFGFVLGLLALSKLIGSILVVVALPLLFIFSRQWKPLVMAAVVFALTAGWWYLRNQVVYGDPLALTAFLKFVGGNLDVPPFTLAGLWDEFRLFRFSVYGLFGHISLLLQPDWVYWFFDVAAIVGGLGAVLALGRWLARPRRWWWSLIDENRNWILVVTWLAAVLALGARWFFAAGIQGRLIFPGLAAGAIVWATGLREVVPSRITTRWLGTALTLPAMVLAVFIIPAYLLPAYWPPPLVTTVPASATATEIRFADDLALRGYTIDRDQNLLRFTFYWETVKHPKVDYSVAVRVVRVDGSLWLDYVNYPGMGTTFTVDWQAGELRRDTYEFDLNRFTTERTPLRLMVGFFDPVTKTMAPISGWADVREPGWATLADINLNDQ
jgi:4-amino-4-deoxy-L-arabinose transferase-like glycosyltransferase